MEVDGLRLRIRELESREAYLNEQVRKLNNDLES